MLLLELYVRSSRVLAHTHYFVARPLQLAVAISQTASLSRAATCVVLWVEIQYQFQALIAA